MAEQWREDPAEPPPQEAMSDDLLLGRMLDQVAMFQEEAEGDPGGMTPAAAGPTPLDDESLKRILEAELADSIGYMDDDISQRRRRNLRYYAGDKFGNEEEGRSQVVSHDCAEAVDWIMPSILRIFFASDIVGRFRGENLAEIEPAKQATRFLNHCFMVENRGFLLAHNWFKAALQEDFSAVKVYVEEDRSKSYEQFPALTEFQLADLIDNPDVEILDVNPYQEILVIDGVEQPTELYAVFVCNHRVRRRLKIDHIPNEELLVARRARNSIQEAPFICHRMRMTGSELVKLGFPKERIEALPNDDGAVEWNPSYFDRWREESSGMIWHNEGSDDDLSRREFWVNEAYLEVDYDGDGVSELRRIRFIGDSSIELLDQQSVSCRPFAAICPNPDPHKLTGTGPVSQLIDVQEIRSTLERQILDNIYQSNNQRMAIVDGYVNIDDLLDPVPGGYVRQDQPGMMEPIAASPLGPMAFSFLEYMETVRENRVGVTRYNQGTDSGTLNKTATGIRDIMGAANLRIDLIARCFADGGMKELFQLMLRLAREYMVEPLIFASGDQFYQVDPTAWNGSMEFEIEIGLGTGQSVERLGNIAQIFEIQLKLMEVGLESYLLNPEHVWNALKRICEEAGFKVAEEYFQHPSKGKPPEPKPDPKIMEAASRAHRGGAQVEIEKQKLVIDQARLLQERDLEIRRQDMELEKVRIQTEATIRMHEMDLRAQREQAAMQASEGGEG